MSSILAHLENKVISFGNRFTQKVLTAAISALTDFKHRHLGLQAAAVSFYVIFSVFPLLAFCVYLVGQMVGAGNSVSAPIVLEIVRDFVPGMQQWIEKGLFEVISGSSMTSWVNAGLLGWSSMGLFGALLTAMESLDETHSHGHRAHLTQLFLAGITFTLFSLFIATIVFTGMAVKNEQMPAWMVANVPTDFQKTLYFLARTRILLAFMSIGFVVSIYKLLNPVKIKFRSAIVGALVFTALLFLSRSAYWIYLHYNQHAIQSTYGIFSTLILIMLWVHFCVNCLMYGCLVAIHMDRGTGSHSAHGTAPDHHHAA